MTGKKAHETELDSLGLENNILRNKNRDLAKGLSDKTTQYGELLKSSEKLHADLSVAEMRISIFKEAFRRIMTYASVMSVQLANIGEDVKHTLEQVETQRRVIHSPVSDGQSNKTRAVKPMVSGHTISRPTIKLARVSAEQLQQMNGGAAAPEENGLSDELTEDLQNEIEENLMYQGVDNESDMIETDEDLLENSETITEENNRLETLQEEDEPDQTMPSSSNQSSLSSGAFRNVKVYIPPIKSAINIAALHSLKRKSTSSQTLSMDVENSEPNMSSTRLSSDCDLNSTLKIPVLAATANTSTMDDSVNNISTIPQINGSLYQETLDETKMPEVRTKSVEDTTSYDPLEGPSTLLDATNNQDSTMSMFRLLPTATDNKTSTPYTSDVAQSRQLSEADKENFTSVLENGITLRRRNILISDGRKRNRRSVNMANCSVLLSRLSPKLMESQEMQPQAENDVANINSATTISLTETGRPLRRVRPSSLKEPSMKKKLRR